MLSILSRLMYGLTLGVVLLLVSLCAPAASLRAQILTDGETESQTALEASYLVNLFKFVQWPKAFSSRARLCFLQRSSIVDLLDDALAHDRRWTHLPRRRLEVRVLADPGDAQDCDILYLDAQAADKFWGTLHVPDGVLTVSDQPEFARRHGGMIEFLPPGPEGFAMAIHPGNVARGKLTVSGALGTLAERIDAARGHPESRW